MKHASQEKSYKWIFWSLGLIIALSVAVFGVWNISKYFNKKDDPSLNSGQSSSQKKAIDENAVISTATIGNIGDLLIHSPILSAYYNNETKEYNFDDVFTYLTPYIQNLDYAVANLEGSLSGPEGGEYSGYPLFRVPDALVDAAKKAGFDMLLTANNHSTDGGADAIFRGANILKEKQLDFIGIRSSEQEKNYVVKNINGIKIGMINYSYGQFLEDGRGSLNGIPLTQETTKVINIFDYNRLEEFYKKLELDIENMKKDGAEAIVTYLHWGTEYMLEADRQQVMISQKVCDMGVDVIVGGHPHVVEPLEILHSDITGKDTVCLYSMGNSLSNQRVAYMDDIKTGHTEDGVLFKFTFSKLGSGKVILSDIDLIPTWVHMYYNQGKKSYQVIPLDKSLDFNLNFNLSASSTGVSDAERSYQRTMNLVGKGLETFKSKSKI